MTHVTVHQALPSCFSHPLPSKDGTISFGDFYHKPESLSGVQVLLVPNSLIVQLVLNATKLQPCCPGFFEACSAFIKSDHILTGGENFCELWLGFAEKGLGVDAEVVNRTP
ncbi:hypothetical protein F5148DRAFT_1211580 [Russula earlei]|uniref:Uncharacterized protein n=1 Tax=Russula earlei TaxID=71964 RepID=A0ACC0U648_9AGAM|nr:hypothetical protein F5148DRAFT_1211580 [Russula earlei]